MRDATTIILLIDSGGTHGRTPATPASSDRSNPRPTLNNMANTLRLLIPGLLGPRPFSPADPEWPEPVTPALAWLLARADSRAASLSPDAVLCELFGVPVATADPPVAALTRLVDGGEIDEGGWWLRADPVHLRADMRTVFLTDARMLVIEPDEAQALVAAFNQTFAEDGLRLMAPSRNRWYLRLPADPGIKTCPLFDAIGRDINPLLPQGPAGRRWHILLTEVQMLFHRHPVNQAREARGRPLINSVWFWGGGACPLRARSPAAGLYANDPLTRGLARLGGAAVSPKPEHAEDWKDAAAEPDSLVVLEATRYDLVDGDVESWTDHVAALERDWFAPLRQWLRTGQISALDLYPGNGRSYALTGAARWRFWRRSRPSSAYLVTSENN